MPGPVRGARSDHFLNHENPARTESSINAPRQIAVRRFIKVMQQLGDKNHIPGFAAQVFRHRVADAMNNPLTHSFSIQDSFSMRHSLGKIENDRTKSGVAATECYRVVAV